MSEERNILPAHPLGEVQRAGTEAAESETSLDTFGGKVHVKWAPQAAVSSLGLMPFFIEFLKTSGRFDAWVEDCPLHYIDELHLPALGSGQSSRQTLPPVARHAEPAEGPRGNPPAARKRTGRAARRTRPDLSDHRRC